jgi:DNA replication protein DnaC
MSDYTEKRYCDKHERDFLARQMDLSGNVWTECPDCQGERLQDAEAAFEARMRAEEEQRHLRAIEEKRARLIGLSNVPPRYEKASLDDETYITDTPAKLAAFQSVAQLADGPPPENWRECEGIAVNIFDGKERITTAILAGKVGTGKTRLACALVNDYARSLSRAMYLTERDLIRRIRGTWTKGADRTEEEEIYYLAKLDVLVIDDVGTGLGTESEKAHLFDVLDARYRQEGHYEDEGDMPGITVICTNLDRKALAAYLGERIFDRLREDSIWVPFTWESYRGAKAGKVASIAE